jgi:hypothetical protein
MRKVLVFCIAVVAANSIVSSAYSDVFGAYKCTLIKNGDLQKIYGFQVGAEIILGVSNLDVSWISRHGPGLTSDKCENIGKNVMCSVSENQQTYLFNSETNEFTRKFNSFPNPDSRTEIWKCEPLPLAQ